MNLNNEKKERIGDSKGCIMHTPVVVVEQFSLEFRSSFAFLIPFPCTSGKNKVWPVRACSGLAKCVEMTAVVTRCASAGFHRFWLPKPRAPCIQKIQMESILCSMSGLGILSAQYASAAAGVRVRRIPSVSRLSGDLWLQLQQFVCDMPPFSTGSCSVSY